MSKNKKHIRKISPVVIGLIIVIGSIAIVFEVIAIVKLFEKTDSVHSDYNEHPGAERYYDENTTIVKKLPVKEYPNLQTPGDISYSIDERGFKDCKIIADYSVDGEYLGDNVAEINVSDKYPTFEIEYVSPDGNYWILYINGNCIMANPVFYNMVSKRDVKVLLSETDTILSYNGRENCFYEIVPAPTELLIYRVDKIDSNTLDNITVEELDAI